MRPATTTMILSLARSSRSTRLRLKRRWATVGETTGAETLIHDIESNDPFQNLGVTTASTAEEVQANFKKLAMMYHPDRPQGNEDYFNKIMKAKESVLVRLGEKSEDDVAEDVVNHEAEYTYNEETTQWEHKRGKARMYNDYIDTRVEKQRLSIFLVQGCILATVAWIFLEDFLENMMSEAMSDDSMHREGRMFAQTKRKDYEKEAERVVIMTTKKGIEENSTYTEEFTAVDPFAEYHDKRKVVVRQSFLSRCVAFVGRFFPQFAAWLRLWLLPDTVSSRAIRA